jgi:hypothetical protein
LEGDISCSKFDESAYHSVRRFVIAKAYEGHCLCVCVSLFLLYGCYFLVTSFPTSFPSLTWLPTFCGAELHNRGTAQLTFLSRPILTYNHQGTIKSGVKREHHTIIYTSEHPPGELPGEPKLFKNPIRVEPYTGRDKLEISSRLNYAKVYTIEHNVKVVFIGKIHKDSVHTFFVDFERTMDPR